MGKIVESQSISRWTPTMASNAISFFSIGRDGLTAEMRRSGRAWKKFGAELGRICLLPPGGGKSSRNWMVSKDLFWSVS